MVRLRLTRVGKKKQPSYRLVAANSTSPRDGRFIEILGHYNPLTDPPTVVFKEDKILAWLQKGAQPTDAVKQLLVTGGIWQKFTGKEHKWPEPPKQEPAPSPAPEASVPSEAVKEPVETA
ncbi:MAG: 30S ribosomal protein S16 [Armatimonadetes bacterium]|nr:30S ribosomal protein S16 [Armatimonadota bacterium]